MTRFMNKTEPQALEDFLTVVLLHPLEEKVHHRIMSLSFHIKLYILLCICLFQVLSSYLCVLASNFVAYFVVHACMASMNND